MHARCLLLALLLRATTTESSGAFELKIESLTGTSARALCGPPSRACHLFFRVCLKHAQDVIDPEPPCTYGTALTEIPAADPDSVAGSAPVRVPFHFKWPGTFSLILEAWSAESSGLDSAENQNNLISRLATRRQLRVGEDWSQDVHFGERGSVRYSYRAVCDQHYHGDACAAYCRPRNDTFGHYSCQRDGRRRCLDGWAGDYCAQPVCASGCSAEHGFCEAPGECACRQGWRGERCDRCARHPGCVHGTCRQPWQCDCEEGWGGLYCDQDLNYCTNHKPCQNGASCTNTGQGSYTCACRPGFSGNNCERENNLCDSAPCRNGGSCKNVADGHACVCPRGFSGPDCGTGAVLTCADEPCFNRGLCVTAAGGGGYTCRCPPGYAGSNCEMKDNRCSGDPCANVCKRKSRVAVSIHPFSEPLLFTRVAAVPEPIPGIVRQEAGYTLYWLPANRRAHTNKQPLALTVTPTGNSESSINLPCMFLRCGRKAECPEKTHAGTGRTCKLHTGGAGD